MRASKRTSAKPPTTQTIAMCVGWMTCGSMPPKSAIRDLGFYHRGALALPATRPHLRTSRHFEARSPEAGGRRSPTATLPTTQKRPSRLGREGRLVSLGYTPGYVNAS